MIIPKAPIVLCGRRSAFTLVEMMVSTVILAIILLLVFGITQQTGDAWKNSSVKIQSFQAARAAFESMTRRISQATLNTYYDYYDDTATPSQPKARNKSNTATFIPTKYGRYSDLHFVTGAKLVPSQVTHSIFFQAPIGYADEPDYQGLDAALNATGFFIRYESDKDYRPSFVKAKERFRLMQFSQPTQELGIYDSILNNPATPGYPNLWFTKPLDVDSPPIWQIAENIVAMVINPKRSDQDASAGGLDRNLTEEFEYDSRNTKDWISGKQPITQNQLPPVVEVIIVAVDEPSFIRLGEIPAPGPTLVAGNLFSQPKEIEGDLDRLQSDLKTKKLKYIVFRADVPIRAAKWSE